MTSNGPKVVWASVREQEVSLAAGLRVVGVGGPGSHTTCQVQLLEPAGATGVKVVGVVPGDARHLALWRVLMTPESEWDTAGMKGEGEDNG